ncbi:MAG: VOC family protein [Nannocystaceae bacterium]|nr:VOC family protein [Nannocystaceae bacterium]
MANPTKLFPLIVTDKLDETRAYYIEELGCELVNEMPGYVQVRFGTNEGDPELSFMVPADSPSFGGMPPVFGGGLIVSIPTENADAKYAALKKRKFDFTSEPSDKPWGWRSFAAQDPNGVVLDFFHVLDQASGADATG